eukprot:2529676-Lingulodinium_polyedra.AAC.1
MQVLYFLAILPLHVALHNDLLHWNAEVLQRSLATLPKAKSKDAPIFIAQGGVSDDEKERGLPA